MLPTTKSDHHFRKSVLLLCVLLATFWHGSVGGRRSISSSNNDDDDQPDYADNEEDLPYELIAEEGKDYLDDHRSADNELGTNEILRPMRAKPTYPRPRHYFPGRNFIYQLSSKPSPKQQTSKRKSTSKKNVVSKKKEIVVNKVTTATSASRSSDPFNDPIGSGPSAQLIPLQLYRQRVQSEFLGHGDGRPRLLNGELQCDCGLYLRSEQVRVQRLSARLQRMWMERRKMRRQMNLIAALDRNLQLVCRSQSRARLAYQEPDGKRKPLYLAVSNATAQSKPVSFERLKDVLWFQLWISFRSIDLVNCFSRIFNDVSISFPYLINVFCWRQRTHTHAHVQNEINFSDGQSFVQKRFSILIQTHFISSPILTKMFQATSRS